MAAARIPNSSAQLDVRSYLSIEGRPIEVFSFGSGSRTILLMAGVHGDEKIGVRLVRRVLRKLRTCDSLPERIIVMPLANPDGYKAGTRRNARGIDVNRNFPTKDFVGEEDHPGGTEPASEPETRAILDVVERFGPHLIITLHCSLACVNYNGESAVEIAERIAGICGLEVKGDIGYPCPGSMGTYYGWERELPVITLELFPRRHGHEADRARSSRCNRPEPDLSPSLTSAKVRLIISTVGSDGGSGRGVSAMGDKSPKKETKAPKKDIKEKRKEKQARKASKGLGA